MCRRNVVCSVGESVSSVSFSLMGVEDDEEEDGEGGSMLISSSSEWRAGCLTGNVVWVTMRGRMRFVRNAIEATMINAKVP